MTQIVARLVLAMLLFPIAGGAFLLILVSQIRGAGPPSVIGVVTNCGIVFGFVVVYWFTLWRSVVRWSARRIFRTVVATILSVVAASAGGAVFSAVNPRVPHQVAIMVAGGFVTLLWLLLTVLLWRETAPERMERLAKQGSLAISCPICGYSLSGLTLARCPECGTSFTLDQLLAAELERQRSQEASSSLPS
jgi:hypothetical protein